MQSKKDQYHKQKQQTLCHFGDDDIIIGSYRFNSVHQIKNFEHQDEFNFYVDTGKAIYLCYFTIHAKLEFEKYTNLHSPIDSLVFYKKNGLALETQLQKAVLLIQTLEASPSMKIDKTNQFQANFERIIKETPVQVQNTLTANWIDTPLGEMLAIADEHQLHLLEFHDRKNLEPELKKLQKDLKAAISLNHNPIIEQIAPELNAYFSGTLKEFKTAKAMHGTIFQKQAWQALCKIPYGQTRSYAKQAQSLGRESAVRAVANANANNKLAIVIPCHRVVGSNGSLTGYAGGIWRKEWLLEHEKRFF